MIKALARLQVVSKDDEQSKIFKLVRSLVGPGKSGYDTSGYMKMKFEDGEYAYNKAVENLTKKFGKPDKKTKPIFVWHSTVGNREVNILLNKQKEFKFNSLDVSVS